MHIARRNFVKSSLFFGASVLLFCKNPASGFAGTLIDDRPLSDEVLRDPLFSFTRETFEPFIGGYFAALDARGETVSLKLVKVDSYAPQSQTKLTTRAAANTESFSLLFNAEGALPQLRSIHQIKHGALGDFNLFLCRRNGPNREIFYEAVFNRLR